MSMRLLITRAVPRALLLLAATAVPLRAQVVVGRLFDASAGQPVAEAFVQLMDTAGQRIDGTLTDGAGRFVLRARQPGEYRLRAERLGYESVTSPVLRVARTTLQYEFELHPRALVLPALDARFDDRGCERRPDGPAVYALWDAIRSALSVASWTGETGALRFSMINHVRELDGSLEVLRSEQRKPFYTTAAMPYRAFDSDHLAREGYMIPGEVDSYLLGPDADVLLSESFLDSHCFRIVASQDTSLIGLGFEPLRDDDRVDVSGVLWVDRRTARLEYLAYSFENVPEFLRRFPPSGEVHFRRMENGLWIVDRWWIRAPLVSMNRRRYRLDGYREDGGTVVSATPVRSDESVRRGEGVIEGVVLDSANIPLDYALVVLEGTPFLATTGATGRYRIRGIPPGRYTIRVTHAVLEDLGVALPVDTITVRDTLRLQRTFITPHMRQILRTVCPGEREEMTIGLVYGTVRGETNGRPLAGVTVHASWEGPPPEGGDDVARESATVTRDDGRYFFCWLPIDREIELRVDSRDVSRPTVKFDLDGARMLRHEFR